MASGVASVTARVRRPIPGEVNVTHGANADNAYVGRRVVVVAGDGGRCAELLVAPLVDAGAEVHLIGVDAAGAVPGLASRTAVDVAATDQVEAALARVGAVVQHLFHWAATPADSVAFGATARAVRPLMVVGGSIVAVRSDAGAGEVFVHEHASEFETDAIRLVVAGPGAALRAGLA